MCDSGPAEGACHREVGAVIMKGHVEESMETGGRENIPLGANGVAKGDDHTIPGPPGASLVPLGTSRDLSPSVTGSHWGGERTQRPGWSPVDRALQSEGVVWNGWGPKIHGLIVQHRQP